MLRLSASGAALVAEATVRRRAEIEALVVRLSPRQRRDLTAGLRGLATVAGEAADDAWVLGWVD
jgi:hypothetical protein